MFYPTVVVGYVHVKEQVVAFVGADESLRPVMIMVTKAMVLLCFVAAAAAVAIGAHHRLVSWHHQAVVAAAVLDECKYIVRVGARAH